jgi:hypothetical protein
MSIRWTEEERELGVVDALQAIATTKLSRTDSIGPTFFLPRPSSHARVYHENSQFVSHAPATAGYVYCTTTTLIPDSLGLMKKFLG